MSAEKVRASFETSYSYSSCYFTVTGLAFAYDPDGYSVEIIKRGGIDFGDAKKTK